MIFECVSLNPTERAVGLKCHVRSTRVFDSTSGGPNRRSERRRGLAPEGGPAFLADISSVEESCMVGDANAEAAACFHPVSSGAAVEHRRSSACASLRNSPWRLLLVHFCPSPVAARHGESAVIPDVSRPYKPGDSYCSDETVSLYTLAETFPKIASSGTPAATRNIFKQAGSVCFRKLGGGLTASP